MSLVVFNNEHRHIKNISLTDTLKHVENGARKSRVLPEPDPQQLYQQVNIILSVFLIVLSALGVICSLFVIVSWLHRKFKQQTSSSSTNHHHHINNNNNRQAASSPGSQLLLSSPNNNNQSPPRVALSNCIIPSGCIIIYISCITLILTNLDCTICWFLTIWLLTLGFNIIYGKLVYDSFKLRDELREKHYHERLREITANNPPNNNSPHQHNHHHHHVEPSDSPPKNRLASSSSSIAPQASSTGTDTESTNNNNFHAPQSTSFRNTNHQHHHQQPQQHNQSESISSSTNNNSSESQFQLRFLLSPIFKNSTNNTNRHSNTATRTAAADTFNNRRSILYALLFLGLYDIGVLTVWTLQIGREVYTSLWPVLVLGSKGIVLLVCIWISWMLRRYAPHLSSPTNNALLSCAILATACLLTPILENRDQWPRLYLITVSLAIQMHTTACLLLTQVPKLRAKPTAPRAVHPSGQSSSRSPRNQSNFLTPRSRGRLSEEAINLISQLSQQIRNQEQLIRTLQRTTSARAKIKQEQERTAAVASIGPNETPTRQISARRRMRRLNHSATALRGVGFQTGNNNIRSKSETEITKNFELSQQWIKKHQGSNEQPGGFNGVQQTGSFSDPECFSYTKSSQRPPPEVGQSGSRSAFVPPRPFEKKNSNLKEFSKTDFKNSPFGYHHGSLEDTTPPRSSIKSAKKISTANYNNNSSKIAEQQQQLVASIQAPSSSSSTTSSETLDLTKNNTHNNYTHHHQQNLLTAYHNIQQQNHTQQQPNNNNNNNHLHTYRGNTARLRQTFDDYSQSQSSNPMDGSSGGRAAVQAGPLSLQPPFVPHHSFHSSKSNKNNTIEKIFKKSKQTNNNNTQQHSPTTPKRPTTTTTKYNDNHDDSIRGQVARLRDVVARAALNSTLAASNEQHSQNAQLTAVVPTGLTHHQHSSNLNHSLQYQTTTAASGLDHHNHHTNPPPLQHSMTMPALHSMIKKFEVDATNHQTLPGNRSDNDDNHDLVGPDEEEALLNSTAEISLPAEIHFDASTPREGSRGITPGEQEEREVQLRKLPKVSERFGMQSLRLPTRVSQSQAVNSNNANFAHSQSLRKHWRWREPGKTRTQFIYRSNEFLQNLNTSFTFSPNTGGNQTISSIPLQRSSSISDVSESTKQQHHLVGNSTNQHHHHHHEDANVINVDNILSSSRNNTLKPINAAKQQINNPTSFTNTSSSILPPVPNSTP